MKTCFSEGKLINQFGNPPSSKRTPPLSTNPPFSEQFFHDPPLCPNFKNKNSPPLILGGEETMIDYIRTLNKGISVSSSKGVKFLIKESYYTPIYYS